MTTEFNLSTPPLLFSAISLILLAYTNRFLSYASTVRNLKERYENNPEGEPTSLKQIENLYRRLDLIRWMQVLGASSLLVSLVAMFLYYLEWNVAGGVVFGVGMVLLALSLCVCIWEIQISVKALNLSLQSIRRERSGSLRQRPDDARRTATIRRARKLLPSPQLLLSLRRSSPTKVSRAVVVSPVRSVVSAKNVMIARSAASAVSRIVPSVAMTSPSALLAKVVAMATTAVTTMVMVAITITATEAITTATIAVSAPNVRSAPSATMKLPSSLPLR